MYQKLETISIKRQKKKISFPRTKRNENKAMIVIKITNPVYGKQNKVNLQCI